MALFMGQRITLSKSHKKGMQVCKVCQCSYIGENLELVGRIHPM